MNDTSQEGRVTFPLTTVPLWYCVELVMLISFRPQSPQDHEIIQNLESTKEIIETILIPKAEELFKTKVGQK